MLPRMFKLWKIESGSGKSSVARELMERISDGDDNSTLILELDWTGEEFDQNLRKALGYENVIGELSDEAKHTIAPEEWIGKFKNVLYCQSYCSQR
jgi:CO dehydrogenase nickel-insertion accessory protein CooC1